MGQAKKRTVEDSRVLSIYELRRWNALAAIRNSGTVTWTNGWGQTLLTATYDVWLGHSPSIRLRYTCTDSYGRTEWLDYDIALTTTPCHYGSHRYWFRCPLYVDGVPCQRRVAKLCLPPYELYFGCTQCHNLTYRSAQEHDDRVYKLAQDPVRLRELMHSGKLRDSVVGLKAAWLVLKRTGAV